MIDGILDGLKDKVGSDLLGKIGLDQSQADSAIKAAGDTVQEVVGDKGMDLDTVMNLFSKNNNSSGANELLGKLGQSYLGKLTGQVGLDNSKAGSVKDLVMPAITDLLAEKLGGNKELLGGLLGGKTGNLVGGLADKVGGLGKMFGK